MTPDAHDARIDRVADRLADVLGEAIDTLVSSRRTEALTEEQAARELGDLLDAQGIHLADGLVHVLASGSIGQ
jgi:hypothetical protein